MQPFVERKSNLLRTLEIILSQKDKIKIVADLAFDAVDADGNGYLDKAELSDVMRNVAGEMRVKPPTDGDIEAVIRELDQNCDQQVTKEEFYKLIKRVLKKMKESEKDLQDSINAQAQASAAAGKK
jgi:Ca2+-binding EF-hand superfamily protein